VATSERRKGVRVVFEKGVEVSIMAIDGTWRRDCIMQDVSETGARLSVHDSIEGLKLKEFFLLLSSTGLTLRIPEKATTLSGAWRPRDPVDDDQGGARA
jgi:hypothetical protein